MVMKSGFCTIILKEENRGLTIKHQPLKTQYSCKKVLACKSRNTKLIYTPNILSKFNNSKKKLKHLNKLKYK